MARGLMWQPMQLSLGGGVETKEDARAADARNMDIARDVQFDELKGAQTRKPFAALGSNIFGGGTITNARRLAVVNGELVLFTSDSAYSWNAQQSAWVLRGTHLAVAVEETPRFVTMGDQIDGDRAELNGTIVYAWAETGTTTTVYAAALDKSTGSVLVQPTAISPQGTTAGRPRLVALATRILLFQDTGTNQLIARAIDPANPAAGFAVGSTLIATIFSGKYDVERVPGTDTCIGVCGLTVTSSYHIFQLTAGLSIVHAASPALTCDGPIAIACDPVGANAQVVRANGTAIQGDLVVISSLALTFQNQALGTAGGTPVNQITAAYSTVQVAGNYVATVFWSAKESTTAAAFFGVSANTVNTANTVGVSVQFINFVGLGSRAFNVNGSIFVWLTFAGDTSTGGLGNLAGVPAQLQNTYFLYRSDGLLVSKAVFDRAGGFSQSAGHLPGVATSGSGFAWLGTFRRVIILGSADSQGFDSRSLIDLVFAFDDTSARRTARLGRTLYVAGGMLEQYEGTGLTEVGFLVFPWNFSASAIIGGGGSIPAGTYVYKGTLRYVNGVGEQERSTTATAVQVSFGATGKGSIAVLPCTTTLKTTRSPAIEIWRTLSTPTADAPFYLATSKNPATVSGDNQYVVNSQPGGITTVSDNMTDDVLATKEINPDNGSVLESLAPPGAQIIIATDTRLFLGGVAGAPDTVWYSRLRGDEEVASFHDALTVDVPREGGAITALAILNDTLIVFRQSAIYGLPGLGFDNGGGGQNFGPSNRLSSDVGAVSMESVVLMPAGLVFKSRKGWYLLDRGWGVHYIGGPVQAFDADTVLAATVVETQHQVRILTNARMLVWDYFNTTEGSPNGQWAEWTISDGLDATMWNGSYVYLTATGPKVEQSTYTGLTYGLDVESSWVKMADLQGAARVRWFDVLGEYRSAFLLRMRVARDYQYDGSGNVVYFDDVAWTPTPATVGSALQVRHSPTQQQCEAFKVRLTAVTEAVRATLVTTALSPQVATSGTVWNSTWSAVSTKPGEMGNKVSMILTFEQGATLVDVRDHFVWQPSLGRWVESQNRIGVRVVCQAGTLTVAALESAIAAATGLATRTAADATPGKTIDIVTLQGISAIGTFTGGAYGAPTGEACKLTGLGLEVGVKSGIYRRLPAAQKT